ncbi:ribosome binding protein [Babesia ovata]|uniref:Ribosome binding protein n=1 Tax=Babesia ovata TaxID=189622 RepID=A0A2H6K6A0_9APIC|nr:ribosome binding protein [Babesia ovata]GBE58510.1 ribosome binding protein [Babesia ovata]
MEGHGIPLGTLKECLQFLMWLNSDSGMQDKVAQNLEKRIDKYFKPPKFTLNNVKSALSKFLENASGFYTRLCYNAQPWSHRGERPDQICNALLECTPKFLTVMYFLWYNVDPSFSQLHGGGWKQNWTGALTGSYWHKNSGGDLDQYLFAKSGDSKHGVIPGGFTSDDEVIYNANVWDRGYPQGYSMARDLDKIVSKEFYNFFRSVFVTSVIADSAKRRENAANAIVLMRTFCDIVLEEAKKSNNGGTLIHELNEGLRQQVRSNNNFICWQDLRQHCAKLKEQFKKIFASKHFDFTGQSTGVGDLKMELAKETANWLRTNITRVQGHLNDIDTKDSSIQGHLGVYFTKNLFPYGFTIFNNTRFQMTKKDVQKLRTDWREVINKFKRSDGDLDMLVRILDGRFRDSCPNVTPPKIPEVPPAIPPANPKADGTPNQGKKSEGAQNQGKKSEGAQNQGKKAADTPSQNTSQSADTSSGTSVGQPSVAAPPTGKDGGSGLQGPKGNKGDAGPPGSTGAPGSPGPKGDRGQQGPNGQGPQGPKGTTAQGSPKSQVVHVQQPPQPPPVPPLSTPPSASADPGPAGKVGPPGQGSTSGVPPGQQPVPPPAPTHTQSPSASSPGTGSAGGKGAGTQGSQHVPQPTNQVSNQTPSSGTTPSAGGSRGAAGKGPSSACSNGKPLFIGGVPLCPSTPQTTELNSFDEKDKKLWDLQKIQIVQSIQDEHNKKHPNRQIILNHIPPPQSQIPPSRLRQPSHPAPGPSHHPTDARRFKQRPYYNPQDRNTRQGDANVTAMQDVPSLEVSGEVIPDTSSKHLQEKIKKKERQAQQEEVDQLKQNEDKSNAEQKKEADEKWKTQVDEGKRQQRYDQFSKTLGSQNERRKKAAESLQKKLDDARRVQEEELKKLQDAPSTTLDGFQPAYQYPHLVSNLPDYVSSMCSVDGGVIPHPHKEWMENERKRRSDDAFYEIHERKQMQLAGNLETIQNIKEANAMELQKFLDHINDTNIANQTGHVWGNTVQPSKSAPLKHQALTLVEGTNIVDPRHIKDDEIRKLQLQNANDDFKNYYEHRRKNLANEIQQFQDEVTKKNKDAIEAEKSKGIPQVFTERAPRRPPPELYELPDFDIQVSKPIVQDPVGNPYDDPYANDDDILRDELEYAAQQHDVYKGFSGMPNTNFDLEFSPALFESSGRDPGMPREPDRVVSARSIPVFPDAGVCQNPWYVPASSATTPPTPSPPPASDQLPPPDTIREMLHWLVGLTESGYIGTIKEHVRSLLREHNNDASQPHDTLEVTGHPTSLTAAHVSNTLTEACLYSASVLHRIKHKDNSKAVSVPDFSSEYSKLCYSIDPARLLCQLRDCVYACCHQLAFLKSQCYRKQSEGGWQECQYGRDVTSNSPLQDFLIDAPDSKFKTHPFDPCNICLKSHVNMGFKQEDLPEPQQTGKHISTILSPTCGGEDPLLTLSSYLTCLTRRTPRTTGELVSFFHNFGNELHKSSSQLSPLGSALSKPHDHCPDWDCLEAEDLRAIEDARGPAPPSSNHYHDKDHADTLSALVGCDITNAQCPQLLSPITYRAYALYSSSFVHHYLSWAVYLADRLWESLLKMHCDLKDLQCHDSNSKSLYQCPKALPLLYSHGITPPDGALQPSLTCSEVIAKLEAVVNGQPIASLMTAMDLFLYHIRAPFLFTITALWLTATLYIAHSLLYRMDVMHIRSHLLTTRASHLIDVKALLAGSRRMLSLYKEVDYFDEDFHS